MTAEWLDKVEADIHNIRAGLTIASREDARALCEIVINLTEYWHLRGPLTEGAAWLGSSLQRCDSSWLDLEAHLNWAHGFLTSWLGDFQNSLTSYERALEIVRQIGAASLEAPDPCRAWCCDARARRISARHKSGTSRRSCGRERRTNRASKPLL